MACEQWALIETAKSTQGRPIQLYCSVEKPVQFDTFIFAAIHGDEPESVEVAEAFLKEYPPSSLPNKAVGVVSVLNPDGWACGERTNANGVDLNRNFPTQNWEEQEKETIYYSGPEAASEVETKLLMGWIEQYTPKKIITLHTPYKVVNFDGPAEALAQAMSEVNGYPVQTDIGYPTPGSFGTYVGKERGIPTITLELEEREDGFSDEAIPPQIEALKVAILY